MLTLDFGTRLFSAHLSDEAELESHLRHCRYAFPAWVGAPDARPFALETTRLALAPPPAGRNEWLVSLLASLRAALEGEGLSPFHAAALTYGDRLLLVCGRSRAGKSCLGLALKERLGADARLLCDDVVFAGIRDGSLELVPVPKMIQSRAARFRSRLSPPDQAVSPGRFALSAVSLVLPVFGRRERPARVTDRARLFLRLASGNMYGDGDGERDARASLRQQARIRRTLADRCDGWEVPYLDEALGETADEVVDALALRRGA